MMRSRSSSSSTTMMPVMIIIRLHEDIYCWREPPPLRYGNFFTFLVWFDMNWSNMWASKTIVRRPLHHQSATTTATATCESGLAHGPAIDDQTPVYRVLEAMSNTLASINISIEWCTIVDWGIRITNKNILITWILHTIASKDDQCEYFKR